MQRKNVSMLLVPPNAKNMTCGAIRPPIIVDLPEFAPVFPTTALFKGAFHVSNAVRFVLRHPASRVCREKLATIGIGLRSAPRVSCRTCILIVALAGSPFHRSLSRLSPRYARHRQSALLVIDCEMHVPVRECHSVRALRIMVRCGARVKREHFLERRKLFGCEL